MRNALEIEKVIYEQGYTFITLTETNEKHLYFTAVAPDGETKVELRYDRDGWLLDRSHEGGYWDVVKLIKNPEEETAQ